uniref:Uncharacterized protein n=1 Tax=Lactuca sativa TaxID=4236 RepID=A0A9R1VLS5_LACSA|nr:hypothetical protein LSAT_V11C500237500 [Lactuca sativa]
MDTDIRNRKCFAYPLLFPLPDSTPHILVLSNIAPFSGFTTLSLKILIRNISSQTGSIDRGFLEIEKKVVLVIRSMRNLQQQEGGRRLHRKFGQGGH